MLRLALLSTVTLAFTANGEIPPLPAVSAPPVMVTGTPSHLRFSVSRRPDGQAHLNISYNVGDARGSRGETSGPQAWTALQGFAVGALDAGAPRPVGFRLDREAGDISCSGDARDGRAEGDCRFDRDDGFALALGQRIGEVPGEGELFHLALSDFRLETLDELDRQGYARPTLDEVMAIAIHRVDAAYVRRLAEAGYRLGQAGTVVAFHIHRVTPAYIAALEAVGPGWRDLPPEKLMALSLHRVSPRDLQAFAAVGVHPTPEEAIALRIHDVRPESVRALADAGYPDLTIAQRTAFRIHGVTPRFIKDVAAAGYRGLTPDQLVGLKLQGGDGDYANRMRRSLPSRP